MSAWSRQVSSQQQKKDLIPAIEVVSQNDNGQQSKVIFVDGVTTIQHFRERVKSHMVERSKLESIYASDQCALRLGASHKEASLFSSLQDKNDIWDFISSLAVHSGLIRFQPWIARDIEKYVKVNNLLFRGI